MNRDQKAAVIDKIAAEISESQAIFAVDYRGITVAQVDLLRARLREADATFRVVKNSLTERAADQADVAALKELLAGPTALTFVRGDAATAAKAVADFARTTQLLAFKGGIMDGAAVSSADITSISRLPSRDVLYGQLVGLVATPISGLARTLNALIGGLAIALGGVRDQKEAAAPAAESSGVPEPESSAPEAPVGDEQSSATPEPESSAPEVGVADEQSPAAPTPESSPDDAPAEPTPPA